jgi:hypothetical protein
VQGARLARRRGSAQRGDRRARRRLRAYCSVHSVNNSRTASGSA